VIAAAAGSAARSVVAAMVDTAATGDRIRTLAEFRRFVDSWHEFYLMAGTAAVTLAGLLFIALSLHMDVLVEERFKALLVVARNTLGSFVLVLIVSLMMLVPDQSPRLVGTLMTAFATVFLILMLREALEAIHHHHEDFSRAQVRRRLIFPLVGYAMLVLVGLSVRAGVIEMLFLNISIFCMLLANGTWSAWDIMVRVGRAKERAKREGA